MIIYDADARCEILDMPELHTHFFSQLLVGMDGTYVLLGECARHLFGVCSASDPIKLIISVEFERITIQFFLQIQM